MTARIGFEGQVCAEATCAWAASAVAATIQAMCFMRYSAADACFCNDAEIYPAFTPCRLCEASFTVKNTTSPSAVAFAECTTFDGT